MRYSTVFKFLAVILCAATLLGSIACGGGLVMLTELGGSSVEDAYVSRLESNAAGFAFTAGWVYASQELGQANHQLISQRYGNDWQNQYFDWTKTGYILQDGAGNVIAEQPLQSGWKAAHTFTLPVFGEYMKVVSVSPKPGTASGTADAGMYQVIVMPSQPVTQIGTIRVVYADGHQEDWHTDEVLAELMLMDGGGLLLESRQVDDIPEGDGWYVSHILLSDMGGNIVYEATSEASVFLGSAQDGSLMQWWLPTGTATTAAVTGNTIIEGNYTAYDAIPEHGVTVSTLNITYSNAQGEEIGSEGVSSPDFIGTIFHDHAGNAQFLSREPMTMDIPEGCVITHITFIDARSNLIFEASCPGGVGILRYTADGCMEFLGSAGVPLPEESLPEETLPAETIPEETHFEVPAAESLPGKSATVLRDTLLYSMPSFSGKNLGTLAAGAEIWILEQCFSTGENSRHWGLTNLGWILMDDVAETPVPEPLPAEEAAEKTRSLPTEETTVSPEPSEPEPIPEPTEAEIPEPAAAPVPADLPAAPEAAYAPEDLQYGVYYDSGLMQDMVAAYVTEPIPEGWTIQLQLAEEALQPELFWKLLALADALRDHLLKGLGMCIGVFALCVVYLCCAAARKRGSDVVKAGGLNRIPLDLHFAGSALTVAGMAVLAVEGSEYLARNDSQLAILYLGALSYLVCLVLVGFFFAFVAQIKTPGGYWWRNSFCGWCCRLLYRLCKTCWKKGIPLLCRIFRWLVSTFLRLLRAAKKLCLWSWDTFKRTVLWIWTRLLRQWRWCTRRLARLFGLLPVTWQFLATGFFLVFLLYVMMRTYKVGYLLLGFGIFFAVILYAASAFAILLESAKRMSGGDLDTKVDDRLLIGGFREFAGELNDLAGVAVVAAQKQLKSERMKTELITNVSHDIKTPLTSIINYVDLLQKPHTEQQQTQYLDVLDRQSQRLKKLIDDLMEMSKASTGNLTVDIQRLDAAETVNQALGEFADKLDRAQLTPVFRQPDDPVFMMADGRLVWRIMSNLLGNAVKYALPGTRIYLDLLEMDGKVIISMKNISREELNVNADDLLERFVRGDASRNTEGSGLGLNIAQSLMELQKGQLQILVDGDLFKVTLIFPAL